MSRIRLCCLAFVIVVAGLLSMLPAAADDWPQFRGVHRDGMSSETGLLKSWPEGGPPEAWRVPLGDGYSSISIVGNRLYTMYAATEGEESIEFAAAFDAKTGKEIWRTAIGDKYKSSFGDGPRSTPSVHGKTVFVLGSYGDLLALSTKDGSERWRVSLTERFGSGVPNFGFSSSPLVDGNQLIIEGGGPEGKAFAALNKTTGETLWTFGDPGENGAGYSSPVMVKKDGKTRYVLVAGDKIECIDDKGKEIWAHPWATPGEKHAMPVLVPPDKIFTSGSGDVGGTLLAVTESGNSGSAAEVWKTRVMRNHFSSTVQRDGQLYGFDNATLRSISAKTGESNWAKRGFGKGSLMLADGQLMVLSDRGVLVLVQASGDTYVENGRVQALEGRCWTAPSLSNGKLYVRNHDEMVSYDLGQ